MPLKDVSIPRASSEAMNSTTHKPSVPIRLATCHNNHHDANSKLRRRFECTVPNKCFSDPFHQPANGTTTKLQVSSATWKIYATGESLQTRPMHSHAVQYMVAANPTLTTMFRKSRCFERKYRVGPCTLVRHETGDGSGQSCA